jgi:hypothetical protein
MDDDDFRPTDDQLDQSGDLAPLNIIVFPYTT